LLDPAADLIDDLRPEPDHVEGVQYRDASGRPSWMASAYPRNGSRAAVSTPSANPSGLVTEPSFVDRAGAAGDRV
jgi:hypothetical protein